MIEVSLTGYEVAGVIQLRIINLIQKLTVIVPVSLLVLLLVVLYPSVQTVSHLILLDARLLDDCYILILSEVPASGVASSSADVQITSQQTGEKPWDIARLVSGENARSREVIYNYLVNVWRPAEMSMARIDASNMSG